MEMKAKIATPLGLNALLNNPAGEFN